MNENVNLWEEKNSIEPMKNEENLIVSEECNITGSMLLMNGKKDSIDIINEKMENNSKLVNEKCGGFCKPLYLIGQKFGKLTVISFSGTIKKRKVWKCKCDCGNIIDNVNGTNLKRGNTISCGCKFLLSKKYNFQDLTGKQFGKLTVIRRLNKFTKWRGAIWECLCECGKVVEFPSNCLTSKNNTTCGDKNIHILNGLTKKELRVGDIPLSHITSIKQNAIKRNLLFSVKNEYLWELFLKQNQKCALSGVELVFTTNSNASKYRKETTASLDRINNNLGYIEGNVRWVHKDVNRIHWKLDDNTFLDWCKKCYLYKNKSIGVEYYNYIPPDWNEWFMRGVYWASTKSKDRKTKIAALIVKDNRIISTGFNGIPSGVNDDVDERNERPLKYSFYSHGESNAIYNAARNGISVNNSILYTNALPCVECCKSIIQSGIVKVFIHKQYNDLCTLTRRLKWEGHDKITIAMFNESNIEMIEFDKVLNVKGYLDGKVIDV